MVRHAAPFRWDELALEKITELVARKVITAEQQTLAQVWYKKGAIVARHAHDSEQVTYVLDGVMRFGLEHDTMVVRAGEVIVIPPRVAHQVDALEDALVITTYSPARRDWA